MNIVIVGGGTAGWISAYLISFLKQKHTITIIDSSKLEILGVGESTTAYFTEIISGNYGINYLDFMRECDATVKTGAVLKDWSKYKKIYYSPIDGSITSKLLVDNSLYYSIQEGKNVYDCNPYAFLMHTNRTNIDRYNPASRHFGLGAVHIDTYKTKEFFKKKSFENNVFHIDSSVEDVILDEKGFIKKLILLDKKEVVGDFFIDASGFKRILMSKLDSKYISFKKYFPVNQAISFSIDKNYDDEHLSVTIAQAMSSGWMWKIPTRYRYGMGYVYSKDYLTKDQAIQEVETFLGKSIKVDKTIDFESGRLDKFWNKNCLCLGVGGSFLEPLQATSIHTTILQIAKFIRDHLRNTFEKTYSKASENVYNSFVSSRVDSYKDFVSCHYAGGKDNTEFWKNIVLTEYTKNIIELAKHRLVYKDDIGRGEDGFAGYELWSYTLEGNGVFSKNKTSELFRDYPEYYFQGKEHYENFSKELKNVGNRVLTAKEFDEFILKNV